MHTPKRFVGGAWITRLFLLLNPTLSNRNERIFHVSRGLHVALFTVRIPSFFFCFKSLYFWRHCSVYQNVSVPRDESNGWMIGSNSCAVAAVALITHVRFNSGRKWKDCFHGTRLNCTADDGWLAGWLAGCLFVCCQLAGKCSFSSCYFTLFNGPDRMSECVSTVLCITMRTLGER